MEIFFKKFKKVFRKNKKWRNFPKILLIEKRKIIEENFQIKERNIVKKVFRKKRQKFAKTIQQKK